LLIIESQARAKFNEFDSTLKTARDGKRDVAVAIVSTKHSDSLMTAIRSGLRSMTDEEASVLRSRQRALVLELRNGDYIHTERGFGYKFLVPGMNREAVSGRARYDGVTNLSTIA